MATSTINKEAQTYTLTLPARMIFPNLIEPRRYKDAAEPKYSASFLIPDNHPDLAPMKAMIASVYQAAFPGKPIETFRVPLKLGATLADKAKTAGKDLEIARGVWVLQSSSSYRPVLSVTLNGVCTDLTDPDMLKKYGAQFYPGSEAYASVFFKSYEITEANWGVTGYLQNVWTMNKGEKLGASSGAQRFNHVRGHVSAENPEAAPF